MNTTTILPVAGSRQYIVAFSLDCCAIKVELDRKISLTGIKLADRAELVRFIGALEEVEHRMAHDELKIPSPLEAISPLIKQVESLAK